MQDARERGAELVFLSAGSEDIARMYGRLGFERVGTACIAEPCVSRCARRPASPHRAGPGAAAVAGALTIAFSAILVKLADVAPSTAAIFRCAYALPVLGLLAWREDRRFGARPRATRRLASRAGVFFAADLIFWHHAIEDVGAGLATVLGNLQVVVVPFAAWALLGERVSGACSPRCRSCAPASC